MEERETKEGAWRYAAGIGKPTRLEASSVDPAREFLRLDHASSEMCRDVGVWIR